MKIVAVNETTCLNDNQMQSCVAALATQASRDFCPAWGIEIPSLTIIPVGTGVEKGTWELVFADNSNQAGALGYHETTNNGDPIGFCFAKDDLDYGTSWTVTASHELLEMLADPLIDLIGLGADAKGEAALRALEVCDAVEDDSNGYLIAGITVSDFVLPEWFGLGDGRAHYDWQQKTTAPGQLLAGGYIGEWGPTGEWTQVSAEKEAHAGQFLRAFSYSRLHRRGRRLTRRDWRNSER